MVKIRLFRYPIFNGLVVLLAFTIPLSHFLGTRILFILLLYTLLSKEIKRSYLRFLKNSWDMALYLLIMAIGLFYSQHLTSGLSEMETSFSLFAFPVIFSIIKPFGELEVNKLLSSFIGGLIIASIACLIHASIIFFDTHLIGSFFYYQFTEILDFQPTYFAYYLCFGIGALLYFIHYGKGEFSKWVYVACSIFLFFALMLTAGRTSYIAMLFIFAFFILKFLFEEKRNLTTTLTFGTAVVLLICMLLINYFDVNTNFDSSADNNNDYWERLTLWESALHANPDFLFGVGTGDNKAVLNDYFVNHGLIHYAKENFNAHNQFIHSFLSSGLLGLFSLLLLLGRPLYLSVKHQNALGIMTFFSFFIYGITEVFLGRAQGVLFFSFLNQVFVTHYFSMETNDRSPLE